MIRDKEFNDQDILKTLEEDPIERNQQLNTFIKLLNSIDRNTFLTIDGDWGSGKTVFVKQLNYLNKTNSDKLPHGISNLDSANIDNFRQEYTTHYYNAWENDCHENPLQSLLFNLIKDLWNFSDKAKDKAKSMATEAAGTFASSFTKLISFGLVDPEKIAKAKTIDDLVKSITTTNEVKEAIDSIIDSHLCADGKKVLFIIDELDRCKPIFAVKLLEVLKHYCTNDKLVFLLSTNNKQLSHTIKKFYGSDFDGIGYLNKFYDLVFDLPKIDNNKYIAHIGNPAKSSCWRDIAPIDVVKHLNLSMREINRYYSSLRLINNYFESTHALRTYRHVPIQVVIYVLVPLAYGLRIHNLIDYGQFIKGNGDDIIDAFCEKSKIPEGIVARGNSGNPPARERDHIRKIYTDICSNDYVFSGTEYDCEINEAKQEYQSILPLINSVGNIDENNEVVQ